ncbi:hypothetical protein [Micromonospora chalcea]|uniref:hypothetical protein n=1 Tax=Micromonospora chalcea TaxID=1874 RepID=UPI00157D3145|nr:hypothetical protein [Micromonospora chalcea]
MRYIDTAELGDRLGPAWHRNAEAETEKITACTDPKERAKAVEDAAPVWRDAKAALYALSHRKCWYCEKRHVRDHAHVDHWRPKKKVRGSKEHPGYWWLACDSANYRLACSLCNSPFTVLDDDDEAIGTAGKGDWFPLVDEQKRAFTPEAPINLEVPILLDPCKESDPKLLGFDDEGVPRSLTNNPDEQHRVTETVRILGLDDGRLNVARREAAYHLVNVVRSTERALLLLLTPDLSPEVRKSLEEQLTAGLEEIALLRGPDREFTRMIEVSLRGMRDSPVGIMLVEDPAGVAKLAASSVRVE